MDFLKKLNDIVTNSKQQSNYYHNPAVCPFLNWRGDPTIRYNFPHENNYCFRPHKPQPPQLVHQEEFCLSQNHRNCPIYANDRLRRLPKEIRRTTDHKNGKRTWFVVLLLILILGIVLFIYYIFGKWRTDQGNEANTANGSSAENLPEVPQNDQPQSDQEITSKEEDASSSYSPFTITNSDLSSGFSTFQDPASLTQGPINELSTGKSIFGSITDENSNNLFNIPNLSLGPIYLYIEPGP